MNTYSNYDLINFGLGAHSFQEFVDRFKTKYNTPQTDGFVWDQDIQVDFTYEQLLAELGIATLPTYVDLDSPAPYKSQEGFKVGTNKIPRMKHGFALNEKIIREKMIMLQRFGAASLTPATQRALLDLLFDSVDKLLAGNVNALTYQRMQVVSTGKFAITAENNPQGLKGLEFDFGVPTANKGTLTTTARWWTNATHTVANQGSASDPIKDMKNWRKAAKLAGCPNPQIEISEALFEDLLTHTKVLEAVAYASYPTLATTAQAVSYASAMAGEQLKSAIERLVGCPIVVRDVKTAVDKFDEASKSLVKTTIDAFDPKNIAIVPQGQLGTIKAVEPLVVPSPSIRTAFFDGGRTLVKQMFDDKTNTQYIESECTALVVPSAVKYMYIYTVTV